MEQSAERTPDAIAVEAAGTTLTYWEFNGAADRLAHELRARGVVPGSTVGILVDRCAAMYVGILATLKAGARYVPLDPNTPHDRVEFMVTDAGVDVLLTSSARAAASEGLDLDRVWLDSPDITAPLDSHVSPLPRAEETEDHSVAYIIYTSGSTGRPKGVAVSHASICNFVVVASEVYGVTQADRVYQGLSISFDFSLEELWTTWATGATLVAGPTDGRQVGPGLADFLDEHRITFWHGVPTVLSTLNRTLPRIRTLNLGGEPCPEELVERWGGPHRRILNTYGPTECTSSCTWAELHPGEPVTIGKPLPTYTCTLRDEDFQIVPDGEVGELCIGGIGVAVGYVGRPELTAEKFVLDEHGGRVYRTGDLGRLDATGNIVYLGRKDAQVKVRGHRVDLGEIEGVMLQKPEVSAAVVTKMESDTGGELAAYLLLAPNADPSREQAVRLQDHCRNQLPPYMVPDYVEFVGEIPLMPSGKADRKALPPPIHPRVVGTSEGEFRSAETATEASLLEVWAEILSVPAEQVSVEADFFTDLGGHSLVAATLVSRLRASHGPGTGDLSIPDLYANPTVRALAGFLDQAVGEEPETAATGPARRSYSGVRIATFGLLQAIFIYVLAVVALAPVGYFYAINDGEPSLTMLWQLALTLPVSYLAVRWVGPVATARLAARGITTGRHPLYGSVHLRVWLVQRAVTISPLRHLSGSHLMSPYLRLLGATVGKGCDVGTSNIPFPPALDLGDDVTIDYGSHVRGFEMDSDELSVGFVSIGARSTIGANSVLVGPCSLGQESVLGPQSLLPSGSRVGDGEAWGGSPAAPLAAVEDSAVESMTKCAHAPREWSKVLAWRLLLGLMFLEILPMMALLPIIGIVWWLLLAFGDVAALVATAVSGPLFVAATCLLILWFRRFALLETPEGIHHLRTPLGVEKWFGDRLLEASVELTNPLYGTLYTPHWLRMLGANVGKNAEIATIANIDPDLLTLQDGAFVADMASVGSATHANGHVAFRRTIVSSRAFVGNAAHVPSGSNLGSDSLVGVLSTPPVGGSPPGTSWLGSPPIYLPNREVYREFGESSTFRPPRSKVITRYVIEFFRATLPPSLLGLSTFATLWVVATISRTWDTWPVVLATGAIALGGSIAVTLVVALMKWLIVGRYRPRVDPLWSNFVRRTEFVTGIFEGAAVPALLTHLEGTPLLGPVLRLFGARIGRRALLHTTYFTEFDLVRVGEGVTVGSEVSLQTHLFEDRVMKMGRVTLEDRSSIGTRGVVLYGATVGEETRVDPLTLVMKGESLPENTQWAGVPARRRRSSSLPAELAPAEALSFHDHDHFVDVPHVLEPLAVEPVPTDNRIVGIDIARGLALLGMMVVHILPDETLDGALTWHLALSAGNSSALFAVLAGVGIALSTGRSRPHAGRMFGASVVALLVRALLIGAIGLLLGLVVPASVGLVILPYYAILFVLAIPFLRIPPRVLVCLSLLVAVAVPIWSHMTRPSLPVVTESVNFTPADMLADPAGVGTQLLLTGVYPALPWVAYVVLGLAMGRVQPRRIVGLWWAVGGTALAMTVSLLSWILMRPLGGTDQLATVAQGNMSLDEFSALLVWGAEGTLPTDSPWWLAVLAPHTTTPLDLLFTMGVAMSVLGLCVMASIVVPGLLRPLATMGSMPLTMYAAHLVMTSSIPTPDGLSAIEFWVQVGVLMAFAHAWKRLFARGPLEEVVNVVAKGSRKVVMGRAKTGRHALAKGG